MDFLVMNRHKKHLIPFITGAIALCLSSCTSPAVISQSDNPSLPTAETLKSLSGNTEQVTSGTQQKTQPALDALTSSLSPSSQPLKANNTKATSTAQSGKTTTLTVYQPDSQCQNLLSEKVTVPAGNLVDTAVGKVLQQADSGDFDLAGYRVKVNAKTGIATIDLRRLPNSKRQFVSLAPCEQFALFGSLRKTLTANPQLKIRDVRFTEQGQNIQL
jgi:hypothetical protein